MVDLMSNITTGYKVPQVPDIDSGFKLSDVELAKTKIAVLVSRLDNVTEWVANTPGFRPPKLTVQSLDRL